MSRLACSCSTKSAISWLLPVSSSTRASASLVRLLVFWLRIFNVSDKSVGNGAGNKCSLALHCPVDLDDCYFIFFGYRVRQHSDIPAMKEIKNPVIDCAEPGSQFGNAVSQQIGHGPS